MNILKRELKSGIKAFVYWSIGLFVIVFAGMTKYTGFSGNSEIMHIFDSFPKIVLAVFGMVGIDMASLGGFYAVLVYYGIICIAIYAIALGCNAVNREVFDKTYEFIFTKPRKRSYIFNYKLLAALIYLSLYSVLNYLFSLAAIAFLKIENTIAVPIALFSVAMWLIGVLFCAFAAFLATVIRNAEKGVQLANLAFVAVFILALLYDILENASALRYFSPLKYFLPKDVLAGKIDGISIVLCLVLTVLFYVSAVRLFERKDLAAGT